MEKDTLSAEEIQSLREENRRLRIESKKAARELSIAHETIERNRITFAARQNLSEIVAAEKSRLEQYMNLLLENCPDMILLFDSDGLLAYCTDSYLNSRGIAGFGMVKGLEYTELFRSHSSESIVSQLAKVFTPGYSDRKTYETEAVIDFGGENARHYSVQITPMFGEGNQPDGAMVFFYDTTELLQAKQEAERASEAKSDFLATVSHEIRTPMNAIIGLTNILANSNPDEKQQSYLEDIQKSSQNLLNLINDILDFSKVEAGKLEIIHEYFDLHLLLEHISSMFSVMFADRNLNFCCNFAADLPQVVLSDEKRVNQMLNNLLTNALKYTEKGTVHFRVFCGEAEQIIFEVEDSGVGIREDEIDKLFTAFEQLDKVRNKRITGTGLGLAITKRLCNAMGGDISVVSEYEVGSTFRICLPLPAGSTNDLPAAEEEVRKFTAPNARVLVVDDIEINLQVAGFVLEEYGLQVDLAQSGMLAVQMAASTDYDIIFMDHMMPEMDGIETTAAIRQLAGKNSSVPIIALTANAVSGVAEMFLQNGFTAFLSKPVEASSMANMLLRYLPAEKVLLEE